MTIRKKIEDISKIDGDIAISVGMEYFVNTLKLVLLPVGDSYSDKDARTKTPRDWLREQLKSSIKLMVWDQKKLMPLQSLFNVQ